MVDAVALTVAILRTNDPGPWALVGHSMGGKIATAIARAAAEGDTRLAGLAGLVLISASPPSAEPIREEKRAQLLRVLGLMRAEAAADHDLHDREAARAFVLENVGARALGAPVLADAEATVLRCNPAAWTAWLRAGSSEDWSARVGRLSRPMLVMYGDAETALGEKVQTAFVEDHVTNRAEVRVAPLSGAGHLAPLERPGELVDRIDTFLASIAVVPELSAGIKELLDSSLTSPRTRLLLRSRLSVPPEPKHPVLDAAGLRSLRALIARVVPGAAAATVASRIHASLAEGVGDGWRFAELPPDAQAWQEGLRSLDAAADQAYQLAFAELSGEHQDALLRGLGAGERTAKDWFVDARGEIVRMYMSDPRTLARIDFRGFADEHGFSKIRLGELEDFES
jgi:pimeloyl-ACP methyl ester carboxylesterase